MALRKVFGSLHQMAEVGKVVGCVGIERIAHLAGTATEPVAQLAECQTDTLLRVATAVRCAAADTRRLIAAHCVRRESDRTKHLVVQAGKTCPEKPIDKPLVKGQNDICDKMYSTPRLIIFSVAKI